MGIFWQLLKWLTSYLLLGRISKDKVWKDILKKTNECDWKQRERGRREHTVIQPSVLAPQNTEKVGSQVLHFQKQLTLFEKSAEWERKMKHERHLLLNRDEGGIDECPQYQWSSIIHSRPRDLKIEERQVLGEELTVKKTWVWVGSGSWWWRGKPGMLNLQRVR